MITIEIESEIVATSKMATVRFVAILKTFPIRGPDDGQSVSLKRKRF